MAHLTITSDDMTGLVERVAMLGLDATTGDPPGRVKLYITPRSGTKKLDICILFLSLKTLFSHTLFFSHTHTHTPSLTHSPSLSHTLFPLSCITDIGLAPAGPRIGIIMGSGTPYVKHPPEHTPSNTHPLTHTPSNTHPLTHTL